MNIACWRLAFKSIGHVWVRVVTGTIAALAISAVEILLPLGPRWSWVLWVVAFIIWSWTWAWAFVHSWTREHEKAEHYRKLLLDEYIGLIGQLRPSLSAALLAPNEAEMRYYLEHIEGDEELIREAVGKFRADNPDSYHQSKSEDVNRFKPRF